MTALPSTNPRLRLHDHGELAAAVPHLLGFRPADSLVAITMNDADPPVIGLTIRVDLPPPCHAELVAETVTMPAAAHGAKIASLVLFGSSREDPDTPMGGWSKPNASGPPHRLLVSSVAGAMAAEGIDVRHAMWLPRCEAGQTWWCYWDKECSGQLPDPASSELAAAAALAGDVTFQSRADMTAMLAPAPRKAWRRTASLLSARSPDDVPERPLSLLLDTIDNDDLPALTEPAAAERVAELVASLQSPDVRTACMSMAVDDRAPGAQRLWTILTRATPPPWRAEPACLLAVIAYCKGNGALAGMAIDIALDADPDHGTANLLNQALQLGLPPKQLRKMLTDMTADPTTNSTTNSDTAPGSSS